MMKYEETINDTLHQLHGNEAKHFMWRDIFIEIITLRKHAYSNI